MNRKKHLVCDILATLTVKPSDGEQEESLNELMYGDGDSAFAEAIDDKHDVATQSLERFYISADNSEAEFELVTEGIEIEPSTSSTMKYDGQDCTSDTTNVYTLTLSASIYKKNVRPSGKDIVTGKQILDNYANEIASLFKDNEYPLNIWFHSGESE